MIFKKPLNHLLKTVKKKGNSNNMFHFKWAEYVIGLYIQPLFAFTGVLTNLFNIIICEIMRRNANSVNIMYKHMYVNSCFSLVYCFIQSLSLINTCIFPASSSFCSSLFKRESAQYFKIFAELFLGNTVKLCSNFSYIAFSASRFFLASANKSAFFQKFEKFSLKLFYSFVIILSLLLSIFMLVKYKPNEYYSTYDKNFPYDAYGYTYCNIATAIPLYVPSFMIACKVLTILELINNVINNIVFIILSLILDICLFKSAGETVRHKKTLLSDVTHLEDALRYRKHITWLVFCKSLLFFFSHVPEFATQILLLVYKSSLTDFCYWYFSCSKILEMSQSLNLVSISLSFFVFKKFDKNFRESFNILVSTFLPKKPK